MVVLPHVNSTKLCQINLSHCIVNFPSVFYICINMLFCSEYSLDILLSFLKQQSVEHGLLTSYQLLFKSHVGAQRRWSVGAHPLATPLDCFCDDELRFKITLKGCVSAFVQRGK